MDTRNRYEYKEYENMRCFGNLIVCYFIFIIFSIV